MLLERIISDPRECREFIEARKRSRIPIRIHAEGSASAECVPRSDRAFESLRAGLRESRSYAKASARIDALEHDMRRIHGKPLPRPRKVIQNPDSSVTLFWHGIMARFFRDGFVSNIGGERGVASRVVTTEFMQALAMNGAFAHG